MQLTIQDIAFGGKGVGRSEGLAVFVPFTIPGETVEVEFTRRKKKYAEADLVAVVTPSPDRVKPVCRYFGRCGGCSYQHLAYPAQLEVKARQVEQTLRRVGKLAEVPMRPIIASPSPYGYRNRIRVHVVQGVTGFYSVGANALIDIEECPIASAEVNGRLTELRSRYLPDGDYTVAERRNHGFFEQTNDEVAREMLKVVEELVTPGGRLVDAYCGAGFFSRHLRGRYEEVIGIEENEFAVAHARSVAIPGERYLAGDVALHLPDILAEGGAASQTTLILDPPAIGASARVLDAIVASAPREVIYVSCNPATLARDLEILGRSFTLASVTPLDMFPQTAEIEVVAHLKRL
jgi:23S rRNA (uracil1939-C5)-methyltransferase